MYRCICYLHKYPNIVLSASPQPSRAYMPANIYSITYEPLNVNLSDGRVTPTIVTPNTSHSDLKVCERNYSAALKNMASLQTVSSAVDKAESLSVQTVACPENTVASTEPGTFPTPDSITNRAESSTVNSDAASNVKLNNDSNSKSNTMSSMSFKPQSSDNVTSVVQPVTSTAHTGTPLSSPSVSSTTNKDMKPTNEELIMRVKAEPKDLLDSSSGKISDFY